MPMLSNFEAGESVQSELTLPDIWRIIRRRQYLILAIAVATIVLTIIFLPRSKSYYSANASVEILKKNTSSDFLIYNMFAFDESENIATQSELISSQRIVFLALQRINLIDADVGYSEFSTHPEFFDIVSQFQEGIEARPVELKRSRMMTDIIEVSANADNPSLAITFVNALVDVYREEAKKEQYKETNETKDFIEQQLATYTRKLQESEANLLVFIKKSLPGVQLEQGDIIDLQISFGMITERIAYFSDLKSKLEARQRGEIQYDDWKAIATKSGEFNTNLFANLTGLENQKARLLEYQLESSPKVVETESMIRTAIKAVLTNIDNELLKLKAQERATINLLESNIEYDHLKREVATNESIVEHLTTSYQDALIQSSKESEYVRIVEFAISAKANMGPSQMTKVLIAILVGLGLGVLIATFLENYNTSIVVVEDVEKYLNLPVLSVIPHITSHKDHPGKVASKFGKFNDDRSEIDLSKKLGLIVHFSPKSISAEAYRALRTNLDYARAVSGGKVILFTSSVLGEGKSTTITNLALTIGQMGKRVLLIDCNLRRPSVHRAFGFEKKGGVTDIIHGNMHWRETVKNIMDMFVGKRMDISDALLSPGLDNIDVITSGQTPANPAELLSLKEYQDFISAVRNEYDVVLIDSSPLLYVTDAAIIAPNCDHVVIIYQIGRVSRAALGRTRANLENVNANILGVVLNDTKAELNKLAYGSDFPRAYYGEREDKPQEDSAVISEIHGGKDKRSDKRIMRKINSFFSREH